MLKTKTTICLVLSVTSLQAVIKIKNANLPEIHIENATHTVKTMAKITVKTMAETITGIIVLPLLKVVLHANPGPATKITGMMKKTMIGYKKS